MRTLKASRSRRCTIRISYLVPSLFLSLLFSPSFCPSVCTTRQIRADNCANRSCNLPLSTYHRFPGFYPLRVTSPLSPFPTFFLFSFVMFFFRNLNILHLTRALILWHAPRDIFSMDSSFLFLPLYSLFFFVRILCIQIARNLFTTNDLPSINTSTDTRRLICRQQRRRRNNRVITKQQQRIRKMRITYLRVRVPH